MLEMTVQKVNINGIEKDYKIVRHSGAVAIVAIHDGMMALVWQTRPAIAGKLLEIPAGTLEPGEEPLACAKRELREETGCTAQEWAPLGSCHMAPGYSSEVIHFFLAEALSFGDMDLDDTEDIEVRWIGVDKVYEMASDGTLSDAKTLAALLYLSFRKDSTRDA